MVAMVVGDVGDRARKALASSGGEARVTTVLSSSIYLLAGGEMLWLGPPGATLHGRAALARHELPRVTAGMAVRLDLSHAREWSPAPIPSPRTTADAAGRAVREAARTGPAPRGFGVLLLGRRPDFPLDTGAAHAMALARAFASGDAAAALECATALLGLGPGLTPSGDDLVGAAFFARRLGGGGLDRAWREAADRVVALARTRTHPISAVLLGDLCAGQGHAPLHELAALAAGGAPAAAMGEAIGRLTRLGHSSGWDLLAGFVAGLGALP